MDLAGSINQLIRANPGALGYALLSLSAGIEYVFPPFPGDTITLFGAFLVARHGWSPAGVFAVILAGSAVGFMFDYWIGRRLANSPERWSQGRFKRAQPGLQRLIERFERHGATYLTINRFIPSLRGLFFVAAGMAKLPARRVLFYGLLSAALWNGLLLGVGTAIGANWESLIAAQQTYAWVALGVIIAFATGAFVWWRRRR